MVFFQLAVCRRLVVASIGNIPVRAALNSFVSSTFENENESIAFDVTFGLNSAAKVRLLLLICLRPFTGIQGGHYCGIYHCCSPFIWDLLRGERRQRPGSILDSVTGCPGTREHWEPSCW